MGRFNEDFQISSITPRVSFVHADISGDEAGSRDFILCGPDEINDLNIDSYRGADSDGSILHISVSDLHDSERTALQKSCYGCYFGIRIQTPNLKETFVPGRNCYFRDALFHGTLTATKMMDVRVSQSRSLPKTLYERIDGVGEYLLMKSLRFLLLTTDTTEILDDGYEAARRLEKGVRNEYTPEMTRSIMRSDDVIAYHWKRRQGLFRQWDVLLS